MRIIVNYSAGIRIFAGVRQKAQANDSCMCDGMDHYLNLCFFFFQTYSSMGLTEIWNIFHLILLCQLNVTFRYILSTIKIVCNTSSLWKCPLHPYVEHFNYIARNIWGAVVKIAWILSIISCIEDWGSDWFFRHLRSLSFFLSFLLTHSYISRQSYLLFLVPNVDYYNYYSFFHSFSVFFVRSFVWLSRASIGQYMGIW